MPTWKKLENEVDYDAAIARIDELIDVPETDELMNELTLVSMLVEEYENVHYALDDSTPLEIVKFMMDMKGIKQKDLVGVLGSKSNVSRILNGTRSLTIDRISALSELLGIPVDVLVPGVNANLIQLTPI
jgi:HTH-type transcriptional regulator / antitoxin HigA